MITCRLITVGIFFIFLFFLYLRKQTSPTCPVAWKDKTMHESEISNPSNIVRFYRFDIGYISLGARTPFCQRAESESLLSLARDSEIWSRFLVLQHATGFRQGNSNQAHFSLLFFCATGSVMGT